MVNILKHPLLIECYELSILIEECGASEELTKAATACNNLIGNVDKELDIANNDNLKIVSNLYARAEKIKKIETHSSEQTKEIQRLQAENQENYVGKLKAKEEIEELKGLRDSNRHENISLSQKLAEKDAKINKLMNSIYEYQSERGKQDNELDKKDAEIKELKGTVLFVNGDKYKELKEKDAEIERLKESHRDLVDRNACLRQRPDLDITRIPVFMNLKKQLDTYKESCKEVIKMMGLTSEESEMVNILTKAIA